jgi:D-methionine transport system substrate-binding protein
MKKRIFSALLLTILFTAALALAACSEKEAEVIHVKVADRIDIPEIWDAVNEILAADNIVVENFAFDSSININDLVLAGEIDMNVAQHYAAIDYYKDMNEKYNVLIPLGDISTESLDLYSVRHDSLADLPDGALIGMPIDIMNGGRSLMNLQTAGLITLDDDYEKFPEERNIFGNPKNLQFQRIDGTALIRTLPDVDACFIYSPTAVYGNLDPTTDPIWQDSVDLSDPFQLQFVLVFTGTEGDENNEVYRKVIDAYHSEAVFKVYKDVLRGASLPVVDQKVVDLSRY